MPVYIQEAKNLKQQLLKEMPQSKSKFKRY